MRDEQVLRYWWDGEQMVRWPLESSQMLSSLDGSNTLAAIDTGTLVPVLGCPATPGERVITERALTGLASHVETAVSSAI